MAGPGYIYYARLIPAILMCTQCSMLLHLFDIGFLPSICLRKISHIQTCLRVVVGPNIQMILYKNKECFYLGSRMHLVDARKGIQMLKLCSNIHDCSWNVMKKKVKPYRKTDYCFK